MFDLREYPEGREQFVKKYLRVFDTNGCIKLCGRQATINLIDYCQMLGYNQVPGYYGDETTGVMNVEHIKELMLRVLLEATE